MATRRNFLHTTAAVGAGVMLTQPNAVHAAGDVAYTDWLTEAGGKYTAAPLPFAYDALEPIIDARTVEVLYDFHHKPAVVAVNKAEESLAISVGLSRVFNDDHQQLRHGRVVYDALYAWCRRDAHI
jgi:Fe-Mn family superoxide dismutase